MSEVTKHWCNLTNLQSAHKPEIRHKNIPRVSWVSCEASLLQPSIIFHLFPMWIRFECTLLCVSFVTRQIKSWWSSCAKWPAHDGWQHVTPYTHVKVWTCQRSCVTLTLFMLLMYLTSLMLVLLIQVYVAPSHNLLGKVCCPLLLLLHSPLTGIPLSSAIGIVGGGGILEWNDKSI